ncbi:dephospho-CoA kinase [mine drainage metagenome]|uniref:Dephospho-CoA kinase n=1 Tax=mine drainage metagenome TaxID=410659 RepID=A0A1J5SEH7_9ZZZZ
MADLVVGLTGGIGSGKSAAATIFGELGAAVVDTDVIAHELTAPQGAAIAALRKSFGEALIGADGALDRGAMRRLVFADAPAKARLEAILHPLIRAESERRCAAELAAGAPYAVLVVPLLVESKTYRNRVARVVVVDCAEETQVARVMARNGLAEAEVRRIMAAQASRAERLAAADEVIVNDGDIGSLRAQVERLHRQYCELARKSPALG